MNERIVILIQQLRQLHGWSIRALSERSGVSKSQINRIEIGADSPTLDTLQKLADAFGVDVKDTFVSLKLPDIEQRRDRHGND